MVGEGDGVNVVMVRSARVMELDGEVGDEASMRMDR